MDQNNNANVVLTPEAEKLASEKQPSYTINNIIALIFVVLLLTEWFWPVTQCSRSGPCPSELPQLLAAPLIIFGIIAGISFLVRIVRLTKSANISLRILGIILGTAGGIFIFIVGLFSAFLGTLRGRPSV